MDKPKLGVSVPTDANGFLVHMDDWCPQIAEELAAEEGITLSKEHWIVVIFMRKFYQEHQKTPGLRILVKHLNRILDNPEKGDSLYLHALFPKSPTLQASRIAGLPKPERCI